MISRFFIDRPVLAGVIASLLMLLGIGALTQMPISRYPTVAPPAVQINANYPGASAKATEDSVTQVIEQNMTGLDGLLYMASSSDANGNSNVTLTFQTGTNPDIAQVQVQNRLQRAMPLLPQIVQQQGVNVNKVNGTLLMAIAFVSTDGSMDRYDIGDWVATHVIDPMSRVPGVGNIQVFGSTYAMRIWLDPGALNAYGLTPDDIIAAVQAQNAQITVGQLGGAPSIAGQELNATISSQSRLTTVAQFRNIVVRGGSSGSVLRLSDVARVELGASDYSFSVNFNGQPAAGFGINPVVGANALATAQGVYALLDQLRPSFPHGLVANVGLDSTPFIRLSIREVVKTLFEAMVLVVLVMFVFLQNLRATFIPAITVPVVLLGTFAVLYAVGYSINMLTMFAVVLAIGLLVDDAIVVVENVERLMSERGLSPREATRESMDQISGALIGIGTVLAAVFVPMAFLNGATGVIYRQFSVAIVAAMALSVLVALILTPALCATLLKPLHIGEHGSERGLFRWFNRNLDRGRDRYAGAVARMLRHTGRYMLIYLTLAAVMALLFFRLPTSYLPDEDQGQMQMQVQAPPGATQERTRRAVDEVQSYFQHQEAGTVQSIFAIQGFGFAGSGQNVGIVFLLLKDWSLREADRLGVQAIANRARRALAGLKDANVTPTVPQAINELGNAAGFDFYLQDFNGQGHQALMDARNAFIRMAQADPRLVDVRATGQDDSPQLQLDVDPQKAQSFGLSMAEVNDTLSVAWGGRYIDDFIDRGRLKRVYLQADAPFRMQPQDFGRWYVRSSTGQMVPVSAFTSTHWQFGSPRLERYNGVGAVQLNGKAAAGVSSGEAMADVEQLVAKLPSGFRIAWTAQSYQERSAGSQTPLLYSLSLLVVFLCLAGLYESWSIPISILLAVPLGVVGAVLATTVRGLERDVYFQVAMLTTIGLASKNAILIVEFARKYVDEGMELVAATLHAVRDRLRPILMTSLAFGFGVLPLAFARGAGAGAQQAIGTGVFGGMLAGTFLGIFFIPVFYVVVQRLVRRVPAAAGRSAGEQAISADRPTAADPARGRIPPARSH